MYKRILGILALLVFMAALVPAANAQQFGCYAGLPPRLQIGGQGQVTPGLPNTLRSQPYVGYDSVILGQVPAGGVFTVLGGPNCYNGMNWWQVNYNGQIGWTPEGSNYGIYWLQPVSNGGCMTVPTRLIAGQSASVLPSLPNVIRSQPYLGYDSVAVGQIPVGGIMQVIAGPNCSDSMSWWLVSYGGITGWTAEGQNSTYWLAPYGVIVTPIPTCTSMQALLVGYTGMVTPGIPNNLRASASQNARVLASMAAGETFTVLSGPLCSEGLVWWQVNYRGALGWTVEGRSGNLWLAPVTCAGFQPSRLSVGRFARVTPGDPNRLRSSASTSSIVLGLIPGGTRVDVIGGPVCAQNAAWWQVNYRGMIGWTMEGQGGTYWLEPSN